MVLDAFAWLRFQNEYNCKIGMEMRKIEQELFISISAISFICCVHAYECCDLETHCCHSFSHHFPCISVSICCRDLSFFVQSNLSNRVLRFGSVVDLLQSSLPLCSSRNEWVMIFFLIVAALQMSSICVYCRARPAHMSG